MANSAAAEENRETTATEAIKAFFDERIEKMSPRTLRKFEKRADKIVAKARRRVSRAGGESRDSAQSKLRASRA